MAKAQKQEAPAAPTFEKGPKCELRPSTPGRNRWCNECNAAYQREYQASREDRMEGKGFAKGVEQMRQAARSTFEQFPFAHFSGLEISKMIAAIPAPRFLEKPSQPEPAASDAAGQ